MKPDRQQAALDRLRQKGLGLAPHMVDGKPKRPRTAQRGAGRAVTALRGSSDTSTHPDDLRRSTGPETVRDGATEIPENVSGSWENKNVAGGCTTTRRPLTPIIDSTDKGDALMVSNNSALDPATFGLRRESDQVKIIANFVMDGEPVSKSRARFTKRGSKTFAYTPEKTKQAELLVADLFRLAAPHHMPDADVTYGIAAVFHCVHRQRRDVDNMIKLLCDGLNEVAWPDDVQVDEVSGRRVYGDQARTEVLVYETGRVERPEIHCSHCGSAFPVYASNTGRMKRKFCSRECGSAARKATRVKPCKECGGEFDPRLRQNGPVFCSPECKAKNVHTELECCICKTGFLVWQSRAKAIKRPICSPKCQAVKDAYCTQGHPWEGNEGRRNDGRKYCMECARVWARDRKARTKARQLDLAA